MISAMGRPRLDPDILRSGINPASRGWPTVRLSADVVAYIDRYRDTHHCSSRDDALRMMLGLPLNPNRKKAPE